MIKTNLNQPVYESLAELKSKVNMVAGAAYLVVVQHVSTTTHDFIIIRNTLNHKSYIGCKTKRAHIYPSQPLDGFSCGKDLDDMSIKVEGAYSIGSLHLYIDGVVSKFNDELRIRKMVDLV